MFAKFFNLANKHKIKAAILILIIAGGAYYYNSRDSGSSASTYILGTVEKGSIITTVSGSGQISSSNQVDVKPEAAAKITEIRVKAGQAVKSGDLLAELDTKELLKSVRDAKNSLDIAQVNLKIKMEGATGEEIRLAKNSVDSAKLSYDNSLRSLKEAKSAADENLSKALISLDNAKISLDNAQRSYDNALATGGISATEKTQSLANAYDNARTGLSTTLIVLRSGLSAADGILGIDRPPVNSSLASVLGVLNSSTLNEAKNYYISAKSKMLDFEQAYGEAPAEWKDDQIDKLLSQAIDALDAMKNLEHYTYLALMNSISSASVSQTALDGYRSSISSQESAMLSKADSIKSAAQSIAAAKLNVSSSELSASNSEQSAKSSLETAKNSYLTAQNGFNQAKADNEKNISSAEADVKSKKIALDNAQTQYEQKIAPPGPLDLATLRIQVSQARNNYNEALEDLESAKIKAPIEGIIAQINQHKGDDASPSAALMSVVTKSQIAELSLNEVDAAKVRAGQKASLALSAIEDLSITGEVVEVDELGTVSQGVVNYAVKISLDVQDGRIKPQMSVSAQITTDTKLDTLMVPNSAVKQGDNGLSYVEKLAASKEASATAGVTSKTAPERKYVETGISNESYTEIISGLGEGEKIIVRTVTASSNQTTQTTQRSGIGIFGGGGPR